MKAFGVQDYQLEVFTRFWEPTISLLPFVVLFCGGAVLLVFRSFLERIVPYAVVVVVCLWAGVSSGCSATILNTLACHLLRSFLSQNPYHFCTWKLFPCLWNFRQKFEIPNRRKIIGQITISTNETENRGYK